jgi:hypothetical protein
MDPGDPVRVTNLDGETADGEVLAVPESSLDEVSASWWSDDRTLWDYWRGVDGVGPDDQVVQVRLGDTTYDYPTSRVEARDDAE